MVSWKTNSKSAPWNKLFMNWVATASGTFVSKMATIIVTFSSRLSFLIMSAIMPRLWKHNYYKSEINCIFLFVWIKCCLFMQAKLYRLYIQWCSLLGIDQNFVYVSDILISTCERYIFTYWSAEIVTNIFWILLDESLYCAYKYVLRNAFCVKKESCKYLIYYSVIQLSQALYRLCSVKSQGIMQNWYITFIGQFITFVSIPTQSALNISKVLNNSTTYVCLI